MSVDTTTSDPVLPADDNPELAATEDNTEAVSEGEDTSQASESEESESEESGNSEETELKDWAAKKNLSLDDPLKLAKMYREAEQALGKKGQKEGQLKTAVSDANTASGTEEYQALKNEVEALSFYFNHPEAKEFESQMVGILEEKPWLASDLDTVLDVAKGRSVTDAATRLKERQAGKKEALTQTANAERGAQPRASVTQPGYESKGKITPDNVNEVVGQHMGDAAWWNANQDAINAALAG